MDPHNILNSVIIGGGPIGLACGIEAKKHNLEVVILEKGKLVNSIYHYPINMTFFSTSEKIEIGGLPFVSHGPKPTRIEALEYYRRVADYWGLRVHLYESANRIVPIQLSDGTSGYEVISTKNTYLTRTVVVATGFYDQPNLMQVPGEELPKVTHYFSDPHPYIGQRVLVVGAANSAIDAALECYRKGAEVTMVYRGSEISSRVKYWVKPDIDNRIREGAIAAYFNTTVKEILPESVVLETPDGEVSVPNDFVLAMTGFKPDYSWLEGQGLCVTLNSERSPIRNETTFESNLSGIYLAGTVCGGMNTNKWFIENSIEHARIIMNEIADRRKEAV